MADATAVSNTASKEDKSPISQTAQLFKNTDLKKIYQKKREQNQMAVNKFQSYPIRL